MLEEFLLRYGASSICLLFSNRRSHSLTTSIWKMIPKNSSLVAWKNPHIFDPVCPRLRIILSWKWDWVRVPYLCMKRWDRSFDVYICVQNINNQSFCPLYSLLHFAFSWSLVFSPDFPLVIRRGHRFSLPLLYCIKIWSSVIFQSILLNSSPVTYEFDFSQLARWSWWWRYYVFPWDFWVCSNRWWHTRWVWVAIQPYYWWCWRFVRLDQRNA